MILHDSKNQRPIVCRMLCEEVHLLGGVLPGVLWWLFLWFLCLCCVCCFLLFFNFCLLLSIPSRIC